MFTRSFAVLRRGLSLLCVCLIVAAGVTPLGRAIPYPMLLPAGSILLPTLFLTNTSLFNKHVTF